MNQVLLFNRHSQHYEQHDAATAKKRIAHLGFSPEQIARVDEIVAGTKNELGIGHWLMIRTPVGMELDGVKTPDNPKGTKLP